jgi:hypothetical protein
MEVPKKRKSFCFKAIKKIHKKGHKPEDRNENIKTIAKELVQWMDSLGLKDGALRSNMIQLADGSIAHATILKMLLRRWGDADGLQTVTNLLDYFNQTMPEPLMIEKNKKKLSFCIEVLKAVVK